MNLTVRENSQIFIKTCYYAKKQKDLTSKEKEELIDTLFNGWNICRNWYQQDKTKKDGSNV